jgi:hypothetical protein
VTKHLNNIFQEGELDVNSTCANFAQVADNGKTYQYKFYSLAAIIFRIHYIKVILTDWLIVWNWRKGKVRREDNTGSGRSGKNGYTSFSCAYRRGL